MGTRRTHRAQATGFTLIELMIVVAIIAILAAIAIPTYMNYITRGKLTDAQNMLSSLRVQMEQFYQDNRQYASTSSATVCGVFSPTAPTSKYFTYSCTLNGTTGYVITATGDTGTTVANFSFTIDNNNTRATTSDNGWYTGSMTNCWVTAKGTCQ
ncbi:type IV pilin protein [Dyella acidisoli]|uniref:Prepilin-type N-terminal cleavage/methylation domain-containing protein n=1 Tax=Dyella acidisoli TaxID=1867834 RepID=A0ABQ5XL39_9GAMM|nr:type IV pilin protein [Dyella acidisoli]GLQ91228.1 hypothetical protein GCM10007901_01780 [Dyella acidisoli]